MHENIELAVSKLKCNANLLKEKLQRNPFEDPELSTLLGNYTEVYLKWISVQTRVLYQKLDGSFSLCESSEEITQELFKNFNIYKNLNFLWSVYYSNEAICSFSQANTLVRKSILRKVIELGLGLFSNWKRHKEGPCAKMGFFSSEVDSELVILVCTEINRFPSVSSSKVCGYSYSHHLKVVNFCHASEAESQIQEYVRSIEPYPDQFILSEDAKRTHDLKENYAIRSKKGVLVPYELSKIYISEAQSEQIVFDCGRWVHKDSVVGVQETGISSSVNNKLLGSLIDFESCSRFISLLGKIPGFNISLTEEEKQLISTPGNVMAIGRSGTGKTTCAVLRLFAAEYLYRVQCRIQKLDRNVLTDTRSEGFDRKLCLHSVFTTLSPVLSREVEAYYKRLKENFLNKCKGQEIVIEEELDHEIEDYEQYDSGFELDLESAEFPLFVSVKKLLKMIDKTLELRFFEAEPPRKQVNLDYNNQEKGLMYVNKVNLDNGRVSSELCFEVDFEYFLKNFWPKIKMKTHLSALTVWTEIQANIKGNPDMPNTSITSKEVESKYISIGLKKSLLQEEERHQIFKVSTEYENWKNRIGAYDFQDFVRHIKLQLDRFGYKGNRIHFLMVDEVQDCTGNLLKVLMSVTEQHLFFAGDTAQTIAKGVGFRFCDLKTLFFLGEYHKFPDMFQLSKNFRSHGKILDLANSIIVMIQSLFPETIDSFQPEVSYIDGPKPFVLNSNSIESLESFLLGKNRRRKDKAIEFGCNQAVIVRNEASKNDLPLVLRNAVCLSVFESKGLEFEEVIIYNFFADSSVPLKMWDYLERIDTSNYPSRVSAPNFNKIKYSLLCTELKHLYVCVTRAKKKILFFDTDLPKRKPLEHFWGIHDLIEVSRTLEGSLVSFEGYDDLFLNPDTSRKGWKKQGIKLMKYKFYEQARKCFGFAQEKRLEKTAQAKLLAQNADHKRSMASMLEEETTSIHSKQKTRIADLRAEALNLFIQAGKYFQELELFKEAGKCYYSGGDKLKAAEVFEASGCFLEAAKSYKELESFECAKCNFVKAREFDEAFECVMMQDSELVLVFLEDYYPNLRNKKHCLKVSLQKSLKSVYSETDLLEFIRNYFVKLEVFIEEAFLDESSSYEELDKVEDLESKLSGGQISSITLCTALDYFEKFEYFTLTFLLCRKYRLLGSMRRYLLLYSKKYDVDQNNLLETFIRETFSKGPDRIDFPNDEAKSNTLLVVLECLEKFKYLELALAVCKEYRLLDFFEQYLLLCSKKPGFNRREVRECVQRFSGNISDYGFQCLLLLGFWKEIIQKLDHSVGFEFSLMVFDYRSLKYHFKGMNPGIKVSGSNCFSKQDIQTPGLKRYLAEYLQVNSEKSFDFPEPYFRNRALRNYSDNPSSGGEELLNSISLCKETILKVYKEELDLSDNFCEFHDAVSFLVQLVTLSKKESALKELLLEMKPEKKEDLMLSGLTLIKMLERKGTRTSKKEYKSVLDSIFRVLKVSRIVPNSITKVLPYASHVLVKSSSELWKSIHEIPEKSKTISVGKNHYLVVFDVVVMAFCKQFTQVLMNLAKSTNQKAQEQPQVQPESLEVVGNTFGQSYLVAEILQMVALVPLELFLLKKKHSLSLLCIYDTDEFKTSVEKSVQKLVNLKRKFPYYTPEISTRSKNAISLYAGLCFNKLTNKLFDGEKLLVAYKLVGVAYRLFELCGYEMMYIHSVYNRFHKGCFNYEFKRAVGLFLANIKVNIKAGFFKETASMIMDILEQFPKLDFMEQMFLYKSCIVFVLKTLNRCYLTKPTRNLIRNFSPEAGFHSGPVKESLVEKICRLFPLFLNYFRENSKASKTELKASYCLSIELIFNYWDSTNKINKFINKSNQEYLKKLEFPEYKNLYGEEQIRNPSSDPARTQEIYQWICSEESEYIERCGKAGIKRARIKFCSSKLISRVSVLFLKLNRVLESKLLKTTPLACRSAFFILSVFSPLPIDSYLFKELTKDFELIQNKLKPTYVEVHRMFLLSEDSSSLYKSLESFASISKLLDQLKEVNIFNKEGHLVYIKEMLDLISAQVKVN